MRPEEIGIDLSLHVTDPEGLPFSESITINGSDVSTVPWIEYLPLTKKIIFKPETNADCGAHTVEVTVDDTLSPLTVFSFTVTMERNEYLVAIGSVDDKFAIVNN